jgi:CRP-like cAMP-binding protein
MYGILEGEIEMSVHGKVIETLKKGDVFGEGALLHEDRIRTSTAIAKTDCKLAFMDKEHFLFAVQQTPMFALEVMRSYSDRFRRLKQTI